MERPNVLEVKVDIQEEILRPMTDEEYTQYLVEVENIKSSEATNENLAE